MSVAATMWVKIGAEITDFQKKIGTVQKEVNNVANSLRTTGSTLNRSLTVPIMAAATGLVALAVKTGNFAGEILKLSTITGISTDKLQELKYITSQIDMDFNALTGSFGIFTRTMKEANDSSSKAAKIFDLLKIKLNDTATGALRPINDVFMETIRRIGMIPDETIQAQIATELFGRSFQELIPLVRTSQEELDRLAKQAHDSKLVLPEDTLRELDAMGDKITQYKMMLEYRGMTFIERILPSLIRIGDVFERSVLPALEKFIMWIAKVSDEFTKMNPKMQEAVLAGVGLAAALGPVCTALASILTIGSLITGKGGIAGMLGITAGTTGTVLGYAAALASVVGLAYELDQAPVLTKALEYNLKNSKPIMQGSPPHLLYPGEDEYEKIRKNYEKNHPGVLLKESVPIKTVKGGAEPITAGKKTGDDHLWTKMGIEGLSKQRVKILTAAAAKHMVFTESWAAAANAKRAKPPIPAEHKNLYTSATSMEKELNAAAEEQAKIVDDLAKKWKELFSDLGDGVDTTNELKNAISQLVNAIRQQTDAFMGFGNMFEIFERKALSPQRAYNRAQAYMKVLQDWNKALGDLEKRGASADFMSYIRSKGPAAVDTAIGLANMNDTMFKQLDKQYGEAYGITSGQATKQVAYEHERELKAEQVVNIVFNITGNSIMDEKDTAKLGNRIVEYLKAKGVIPKVGNK